jgi:hypothetical protein
MVACFGYTLPIPVVSVGFCCLVGRLGKWRWDWIPVATESAAESVTMDIPSHCCVFIWGCDDVCMCVQEPGRFGGLAESREAEERARMLLEVSNSICPAGHSFRGIPATLELTAEVICTGCHCSG